MLRSAALFMVFVAMSLAVRPHDVKAHADVTGPACKNPVAASRAAEVDGKAIDIAEVDQVAADRLQQVRAQEYEIRRQALDELIDKRLLEKDAVSRQLTVAALLKAEVEEKIRPVTEEDARAGYEANKARYTSASEADALKRAEADIRAERLKERRAEFLKNLRERSGVKVLLEPPRLAIAATSGPSAGPADAPVTVVEFSDFQCPFCRRVAAPLKQLRERYGDKVHIVFMNYPLSFHANAAKAAEAALCADEQGQFWQFHDRLFENQTRLDVSSLHRYAAELGLDKDRFETCLDAGRYRAEVQAQTSEGSRLGVSGTPALFVNGRPMSGAQSYEALAKVVEEELERGAQPKTVGGKARASR
jgi:protein-disulfide isomerase